MTKMNVGVGKKNTNGEMTKMSDYGTPKCTYKKMFPIDEYGRPGGFYSLADLPIWNEKVLVREGTVLRMDSEMEVYEVKDSQKGWTFILPMKDVEIIEKD